MLFLRKQTYETCLDLCLQYCNFIQSKPMIISRIKFKNCFLLFSFLFWQQGLWAQKSAVNFLQQYKPIAYELMCKDGIPTSVILGISMIESGMGQSKNCKLLHNFFGVKGKNQLAQGNSGHRSAYKQFGSPKAAFEDFARMIKTKKYYPALKGNMDYHLWLVQMNKYGYAEAKGKWINEITKVIIKYNLTQYDTCR